MFSFAVHLGTLDRAFINARSWPSVWVACLSANGRYQRGAAIRQGSASLETPPSRTPFPRDTDRTAPDHGACFYRPRHGLPPSLRTVPITTLLAFSPRTEPG